MIGEGNNPHIFGLDKFVAFIGVVEDRDDPIQMGRCRIRIVGLHHPDKEIMPTEDLPWAMPVQPIMSAAAFGIGHAPLGPVPGTHVVGFFADGMDRQIPFFFGTIAGGVGQFNSSTGKGNENQNEIPPEGESKDPNKPYTGPVELPKTGPTGKSNKSLVERGVNLAIALKKAFPELPLKDNHVAAVVGNMWVESMGFQYIREGRIKQAPEPPWPKWQKGQKVEGTGYGWAQWSGPRLNNFIDYCSANKLNAMSDAAQWGFLIQELKTDYYYVMKKLASNVTDARALPIRNKKLVEGVNYTKRGPWNLTTPDGACGYFMAAFENPNPKVAHFDRRCEKTRDVLYAMNKANVPSSGVSLAKK